MYETERTTAVAANVDSIGSGLRLGLVARVSDAEYVNHFFGHADDL